MVSRRETLERLNMERDSEDKLVQHITTHFIDALDGMDFLNDEEKNNIRNGLNEIIRDDARHSYVLDQLAHMVCNHGPDNY